MAEEAVIRIKIEPEGQQGAPAPRETKAPGEPARDEDTTSAGERNPVDLAARQYETSNRLLQAMQRLARAQETFARLTARVNTLANTAATEVVSAKPPEISPSKTLAEAVERLLHNISRFDQLQQQLAERSQKVGEEAPGWPEAQEQVITTVHNMGVSFEEAARQAAALAGQLMAVGYSASLASRVAESALTAISRRIAQKRQEREIIDVYPTALPHRPEVPEAPDLPPRHREPLPPPLEGWTPETRKWLSHQEKEHARDPFSWLPKRLMAPPEPPVPPPPPPPLEGWKPKKRQRISEEEKRHRRDPVPLPPEPWRPSTGFRPEEPAEARRRELAASKAAKLAEDLVGRMERYGRRHRDISEKTLAADEKRRKASDAAAAIATTLTGRVARELEKEHRRMERYDRMHRAAAEKTAASAARETELRRRRETAWKDYLFAEGVSDVSRKMREAEAARRERERTTIGHVGGFRDVAGIAGSAATLVASPDPSAASTISGFGSIVGEAGSALAKIHPVAGAVVSAIGATVGAFGNLMKAIDATAARYAEFSPVIAQAEAYSQIRQTLGDLRRAQEIAPAMVKYIQARTDVQQKFEDIKVKLLQKLVPMVAHILDVALPFIEYQGNRLEFLSNLSHLPAILELLSMIANLFKDNDLDEKMLKEWDPTRMIMEGYLQPGQERGPGGGRGIQVPEV